MKTILTANFSLADLYEFQSHELHCFPIDLAEARDQLKYGFLSVVSDEATAQRLSAVLGVPVPVSEDQLELKTDAMMVVAQLQPQTSQGIQFWLLALRTTYLHRSGVPESVPPVCYGWCTTCGFRAAGCRCEERTFQSTGD